MIAHFEKVLKEGISAEFTGDRKHRVCLTVPLQKRNQSRVLCVIGQNPSLADENEADKTLRYIEEYVFTRMPDFGTIRMLNLYSKIDTDKVAKTDLCRPDVDQEVERIQAAHNDFLFVTGKASIQGKYDFPKRVKLLSGALLGKNTYKIDIGSSYPPHPGNPKIVYSNFEYCPTAYKFEDVT